MTTYLSIKRNTKQMKFHIPAVAAVVLLAACNTQNKDFVVNAEIKGAPVTTVYLEQISFENMPPQVVDSAQLNNGKFSLKAKAAEEGLYQLRFPQQETAPVFLLINDEKEIAFTTDWNNQQQTTFKTQGATARLKQLLDTLGALQQQLMMGQQQLSQPLQGSVQQQDSVKNAILAREKALVQRMRDHLTRVAITDASPALSLFAAAMNMGGSMEEAVKMNNQLLKRFPKHTGIQKVVKAFEDNMAAVQKQQEARSKRPVEGSMAPDITMPDPYGKPFSLSQLRGKYVLVDFWASWCAPCRAENPNVVAAYQRFKDKNFTVLGVSLDKSRNEWLEAIEKDKLTWFHISDLKFWESAAVELYGFDGIPYNVLVDPEGKIIATNLRGEALPNKLAEVLK